MAELYELPCQSGDVGCDFFAIAYAAEILLSGRLESLEYMQHDRRKHLVTTLIEGTVTASLVNHRLLAFHVWNENVWNQV